MTLALPVATMDAANLSAKTPWIITWATWPILFLGSMATIMVAIYLGWDLAITSGAVTFSSAIILVILEFIYPLEQRWKMTWPSFRRDLKYFAVNGMTIAAVNAGFAYVGISLAGTHHGPISNWPLYIAVPAGALAVEFLQYWQHRFSHEARGPIGRWLWRVHVAHHLPDKVYVVMHPAGHPINGLIVRGFVTIIPLYFLGASAAAVAIVTGLFAVQGLVSHTNIDLRAGWFNYIFTGSELHRYHHSADPKDNGNYATALSFLDVVFGTQIYRPGNLPSALGVRDTAEYPHSTDIVKVMMLPFR